MTTPSSELRAFFDHHIWATSKLMDPLETLGSETLDSSVPGTYGSILATLTHLVFADDRYLTRLTTTDVPEFVDPGSKPLSELRPMMREIGERWTQMLDALDAGTLHARIVDREDMDDLDHAEGLLLLQAIHHGNDHRTQICSTLGALGLDVPDLDGWAYWETLR